jgi:hypothetical protein
MSKKHNFKHKNICFDSEESDSEDEEFDNDELKEICEDKLGKSVKDTSLYSVHFPDVSQIINIKLYNYNNDLNKEHFKQMINKYRQNKEINGIFTTVINNKGKIGLLDGHHRLRALKKAYKLKNNIKPIICVHNYIIDDENSIKTRELFNNINRVKPFNNDAELLRHAHFITNRLRTTFKGRFKENSTRANKPNVLLNDVFKAIKTEIINIGVDKVDDDKIYDTIIDKNEELSTLTFEEILIIDKKLTDKQYEKMDEFDFYLSLYTPELWFD